MFLDDALLCVTLVKAVHYRLGIAKQSQARGLEVHLSPPIGSCSDSLPSGQQATSNIGHRLFDMLRCEEAGGALFASEPAAGQPGLSHRAQPACLTGSDLRDA